MIFEDIHWIDPTSLELLAAMVEHMPRASGAAARHCEARIHAALARITPHMTTIPLTRLGRRDGAALIERVTGGKTLPKEVMDEILARTDGVPMFIEELTKTVLESQTVAGAGRALCARASAAAFGDPDDIARVADGAS